MKQFNFKKLLPHIIAIAIFLIVAVVFCKPALDSENVLQQGDISGWEGMSHQSFQYKEAHGHYPLWATSMFSGMPAFQIAMDGPWNPLGYFHTLFTMGLPTPISFFFLACLAFYFLCQCLRLRPWASILGALAFAYCSFDPIIITAGHNTQMFALAYAPALLGAVILIFEKKYITGFVLTTLIAGLEFLQNHQQITYYLFLAMGVMGIAYLVRWIKAREISHMFKAIGLAIVGLALGIMLNANNLYPVYDFSKESKRAGQLVMDNSANKKDAVSSGKTSGLSKDYAFMWSYGKMESLSLMFPAVKGYGLYAAQHDGEQYLFPKLDENSNVAKYLTEKMNVPDEQAGNYALQSSGDLYWGDQPGTNGPVYLGAIVCFLFIFGMFYLDGKHKWWLLAASVLGIMLAWGNNFAAFNYFLFDHLPFYNKFRVPTMAMVIPQLLFPIVAALTFDKLIGNEDSEGWKKFQKAAMVTGAIFVIVAGIYFSADFSKENKDRTKAFNEVLTGSTNAQEMQAKMDSVDQKYRPQTDNQVYENMVLNMRGAEDAQQKAKGIVNAIRKDRASLLGGSLLRSFLFVLVAIVLIALYLKEKIKSWMLIAGLTLATAVDLLAMDSNYLNEKSFDNKDKYQEAEHPLSAADQKILTDTDPNYRVFNYTGSDPFQESKTSYYHKSIGGYHPAKLGIYDDLATNQLSGSPNPAVLNMLNAKYIIQSTGRQAPPVAVPNKGALGNCWFVKAVSFVNGPVAEMKALNNFDPKDTAFVDEHFKNLVTAYTPADSSSSIRQTAFDNDDIKYESNTTSNNLAVFSEIYYKDWNAYIDGKPADYFKANYVLRAMVVPAGKHSIEFKFEPKAYYTGIAITKISTWILSLLVLAYIGWLIWPLVSKRNKATE